MGDILQIEPPENIYYTPEFILIINELMLPGNVGDGLWSRLLMAGAPYKLSLGLESNYIYFCLDLAQYYNGFVCPTLAFSK